MTPSMKAGVYHVFILLERSDSYASIKKATCCRVGHVQHVNIAYSLINRKSASCTHISAILHCLVSMCPLLHQDHDQDSDLALPVTSFVCQWKPSKNREKLSEYGRFLRSIFMEGRERNQWKNLTQASQ